MRARKHRPNWIRGRAMPVKAEIWRFLLSFKASEGLRPLKRRQGMVPWTPIPYP
jgi:hypothetical protein